MNRESQDFKHFLKSIMMYHISNEAYMSIQCHQTLLKIVIGQGNRQHLNYKRIIRVHSLDFHFASC